MQYEVALNGVVKQTVTTVAASFTGLTPYTSYTATVTPLTGIARGTAVSITQRTKGPSVTITHNLGKSVTVAVSYYEYALGTEPDGLGTGPYGLGGSDPVALAPVSTTQATNAVTLELPITWTPVGSPAKGPDGAWYLTNSFRTLRFLIS